MSAHAPRRGPGISHCRFRTSFGGALFCQHAVYLEGFCEFHFAALQAGELTENGVLNELLSDQVRRREINFHGIRLPQQQYLDEG